MGIYAMTIWGHDCICHTRWAMTIYAITTWGHNYMSRLCPPRAAISAVALWCFESCWTISGTCAVTHPTPTHISVIAAEKLKRRCRKLTCCYGYRSLCPRMTRNECVFFSQTCSGHADGQGERHVEGMPMAEARGSSRF